MLLSVGGLSVLQEAVGDRIPLLLLGNKVDNEKEREVPRGLGEQLAKVRGEHPPGTGRDPEGSRACAQEPVWEPSLGAPRGTFRRELDSGVGNFPDSLPWNSEL